MQKNDPHALFTIKYAPKKLQDIIGNSDQIEHIRQWVLQWLGGKQRKPLLLHGPPGTGKTSVAYVLKYEFDLEIIEMNASELRNKQRVERILGSSALAGTLFGNLKLILIDDADILAGRKDSGGGTAIKNFLAESPCPAIVTATDIWDKSFTPIRSECELVDFKRINKLSIKKLITTISKSEGLNFGDDLLERIAQGCEGDVRAALNDLQSFGPTWRVHEKDIFQLVRGIFKAEKYSDVREILSGDLDYDLIKLWIDENIPLEYESRNDIAAAYDSLSKADVFDGRIMKSNWQFMKYSIDLTTAGVALAKKTVYRKFTKYQFPSYLRNMARSMERRAMLKAVGKKIGSRIHTNRRDALGYLPILKEFASEAGNAERLMSFYDLSDDEMAFVMETSVNGIKRKS